jgi:hypothetical protein
MFFNKKILTFLFLFLISGCASNNKAQIDLMNDRQHRPSMNPGGDEFGNDPEFCKSYNKLQYTKEKECRKPRPKCQLEPCPSGIMEDDMPRGATLIEVQKAKEICKCNDNENLYELNCVRNEELPEQLRGSVDMLCKRIIEEKPLPEVVLNNGKTIVSADCVDLGDIDIVNYEDACHVSSCKKKVVQKSKTKKKIEECAEAPKKKKFFKISY